MVISAELATSPPGRERKAERKPVRLGAGLRQSGSHKVTVNLIDLSTHGFKVETYSGLYPGTDVWITLPGLAGCHARVVWAEGTYLGCEFVNPLHPAVIDMIAAKGPQD